MDEGDLKRLISKKEEGVKLLKELEQSLKYEKKRYHLIKFDEQPLRGYDGPRHKTLGLFLISERRLLVSGPMKRIRAFIRLRNVDTDLIYMAPEMDKSIVNFIENS
jgi:hypothetical protein